MKKTNSFDSIIESLKNTKATWQKDGGGVRGTPQLMQRFEEKFEQQTTSNFPQFQSKEFKSDDFEPNSLQLPEVEKQLPQSIFNVCLNGQPCVATLYGVVKPLEEEE